MNKKVFRAAMLAFLLFLIMVMFCGCSGKGDVTKINESALNDTFVSTAVPGLPATEIGTEEMLSDEQALSAIRSYCCTMNPDLENIVKTGKYPVYWNVSSSDEHEIVVLFRSYTGAQNRYYIDRITGDTYVTEFVPGITEKEQRSDESFNVRDFFPGD